MINFKNVTKIYESGDKKVKAVDNISFHVNEGEICVFLGPSGCGKTTLLRMVNRLISITSGTIEVDGKDVNSVDEIMLRRSIGYVIQQNGLFPNMTIEENICVVPKMLGWDQQKMRKRYNELMEMMGLHPDEYRKRYPYELSGGQQQRVGVARALAADPPVMLMDEPFGALDPVIREHIQNEFLRIQQDVKKTILFVSHDIDEAIKLGDKIAVFNTGELMQYGTPDDILSNPKNDFVRDFIGGDRALKRLTLLKVKDLITKLEDFSTRSRRRADLITQTISINENLRTALSFILDTPTGEAWVIDENHKKIGVIRISDFEILTDIHPNELTAVR
ncbi:ABC transporter ATP-binding protein [Calidifontibacillus erzurumensis]|uniref:Quaternary amine transport ATP-binding protein n=1 Tax=Calidifontibacillus erzurumensis TaxID=2741433 RepID=A0A8J8GFY1_9BACI|nr:ABC transporter ATP-binding protein [Calidifontibacillus erzurumensis]NSL53179.1 ABC transporter ATP-binding protein [Calidifontibacillus erzurumensis]